MYHITHYTILHYTETYYRYFLYFFDSDISNLDFGFGDRRRLRHSVGALVRESRQNVAQKLEASGSSPLDGNPLFLFVVVLRHEQELGEKLLIELSFVALKRRNEICIKLCTWTMLSLIDTDDRAVASDSRDSYFKWHACIHSSFPSTFPLTLFPPI